MPEQARAVPPESRLGVGLWRFGLRPEMRLPIRVAGVTFFLSGVKRRRQPWIVTLRKARAPQ